jgi:hypothetical protein
MPFCFSLLPSSSSLFNRQDNDDKWTTDNDLQIQTCAEQELPSHQWIPIEGIYGVYLLPSGLLWVLITETEPVYELSTHLSSSSAIPSTTHNSSSSVQSSWQIRRVQSMELFHQAFPEHHAPLSTLFHHQQQQQQKEEARQLHLLRNALKEHDFYFVPSGSAGLVPDMTRNLQKSFDILQHETTNATNTSCVLFQRPNAWWKRKRRETTTHNADDDLYPDSRFFWNEVAVYPLLHAYEHQTATAAATDSSNSKSLISSNCLATLLDHVIPVTSAFCGVQTNLSIASPASVDWRYDQLLISRRSRFRAGTRFAKRGADAVGHVANYAETEQICIVYPTNHILNVTGPSLELYSHVQIRGSIPLRWSSPTDITTYRPRVRIGTDPLAQARSVWAHIVEQLQHYTTQDYNLTIDKRTVALQPQLVFCNLIDKKSDQGRLGRAFDAVLQAVLEVYGNFEVYWNKASHDHYHALNTSDSSVVEKKNSFDVRLIAAVPFLTPETIKHVWFDFHAEVKGGNWEKLGSLLQQLSPAILQHGYFAARLDDGRHWTIAQRQSGIVRTNCMDCLDRTNVVQSIIGRFILFRQLSRRRGSSELSRIKVTKNAQLQLRQIFPLEYNAAFRRDSLKLPWVAGETAHRLLWADNADLISRLYAGTAALKGDFTRTGKRTKRGALDDGMNSLQRYYLNNFLDADRQEGIDLMVGEDLFSTRREILDGDKSHVFYPGKAETLKEAVRAMMLGRKGVDENASDERLYIRIKQPKEGNQRTRKQGNRSDPLAWKIRRPLLELRWLSGDLQHQMRGRATNLHESSFLNPRNSFFPSAADRLEAMEQRLTTEVPWWVGADSETDEESDTNAESTVDGTSKTSTGQLLGAMMAAYQAPITTATVTVALLGLLLEQKSKLKRIDE